MSTHLKQRSNKLERPCGFRRQDIGDCMSVIDQSIWGASIVCLLVNVQMLRNLRKLMNNSQRRNPERVQRVVQSAPYHRLIGLLN